MRHRETDQKRHRGINRPRPSTRIQIVMDDAFFNLGIEATQAKARQSASRGKMA